MSLFLLCLCYVLVSAGEYCEVPYADLVLKVSAKIFQFTIWGKCGKCCFQVGLRICKVPLTPTPSPQIKCSHFQSGLWFAKWHFTCSPTSFLLSSWTSDMQSTAVSPPPPSENEKWSFSVRTSHCTFALQSVHLMTLRDLKVYHLLSSCLHVKIWISVQRFRVLKWKFRISF